ncbi:MAG: hypothetical protein ACREVE_08740 [Gammaproteobacteria bacterium]
MFGLTLRERAAEALRRGARAAMTGAYFHHTKVAELGLNDEASAWLYTEGLAHQIYALGLVYGKAFVGKEKWATPDFFFASVGKGLAEADKENGLPPTATSSFVFKRFLEMEALSGEERHKGEHFRQSVVAVQKKDARASAQQIIQALEAASSSYFQDVRKMFLV